MFKLFSENKSFFYPFFTYIFLCSIALLLFDKDGIQIAINQRSHKVADVFFKYITYLGDGRMIIFYAAIVLFFKYRYLLILLLSNLLTGTITMFLKFFVFDDSIRPAKHFENLYQLRFVPDVEVYVNNSMPSGHTATAFCVFSFFLIVKKE